MRFLRLSLRALRVSLAVLFAVCAYATARLRLGLGAPVDRVLELRGEHLARLLESLGATSIKFGQILSTRPDLLPPAFIFALARLQDRVPPAPFADIERVLDDELAERRAEIEWVEAEPVAAASVAQVHRARTRAGETLALKVQRPEAASQIDRDLAIMSFGARLLDRIPSLRMLSLPGSLARFAESLRGQLDFRAEAAHNRRFAENFAAVPGVSVPRLHAALCTRRVLAMEFVEGVRATEPERIGGDRKLLARRGAECILKMVFNDGFVHADLHPGNILLTADGGVVLLDLGMVTDIPGDLLRPWVQTFLSLSQGDGAGCARVFYGYAPSVGAGDYASFERDVVARIDALQGKKLHEVEVSEAVGGMMNVLRKHRVQIDPVFTVVNIAILVAEGLGKQLDPELDLVPLAAPYLADAMLKAPPAREPLRDTPSAAA
jgi:ubiquinone biosynthesis protein